MSINIIKSTDEIIVQSTVCVIYGPPGLGKTSISCSADLPFVLDFDNGLQRSSFRSDGTIIKSWNDVINLNSSDLKNYKTLVIDTAGKALDMLSLDIMASDSKMARRSGDLTMNGYGALKSKFSSWIKKMLSFGLDIIIVCHCKEDKNGDDMIFRPKATGGSYDLLFEISDSVGYMHSVNNKAIIDFSPTDSWVGKNPGYYEPVLVPNLSKEPDFMAKLLSNIKSKLGSISRESKVIAEKVFEFKEVIDKVTEAGGMNDVLDGINKSKITDPRIQTQVKALMNKRIKEIGVNYNKELKAFVPNVVQEKAPVDNSDPGLDVDPING